MVAPAAKEEKGLMQTVIEVNKCRRCKDQPGTAFFKTNRNTLYTVRVNIVRVHKNSKPICN